MENEKRQITLIGLSGKIRNGKDEIAGMIKDIMPEVWYVKKFAGKLKEIVSLLTGISVEDLEKQEIKEKPLGEEWRKWFYSYYKLRSNTSPEGRVSRYFSTEQEAENYNSEIKKYFKTYEIESELLTPRKLLQLMGTECGRDILHPNLWVNSLFVDYVENPNWIITDVRFPNEAEEIKKRGGIVIRVNRKGFENTGDHPSETSLDNYLGFNHVIENDGTLEQLYEKVENLLQPIIYSRTL